MSTKDVCMDGLDAQPPKNLFANAFKQSIVDWEEMDNIEKYDRNPCYIEFDRRVWEASHPDGQAYPGAEDEDIILTGHTESVYTTMILLLPSFCVHCPAL